jgi:hypothetical protein
MGQLYAPSLGVGPRGLANPERAPEADERSRVVELALRPESRPKARRPQRALAREALSLGEQNSSCRASKSCGGRAASRAPRTLNATRVGLERTGVWPFGTRVDDSVLVNGRARLGRRG